MFRLNNSKYISFIAMLVFAIMLLETSVHGKTHLFDHHDCVTCQIVGQNLDVQLIEHLVIFSTDLNSFYSFFFLDLVSQVFASSQVLARAPPFSL